MTEELERKLNELLGMKKQLEEITEEKKKEVTGSVLARYQKELRIHAILLWVRVVLGFALISVGMIAIQYTPGVLEIRGPAIVIAGFALVVIAGLNWKISQSKLTILKEMKQYEMRMTELLKKGST